MDFTLSPEQQSLADSAARFCAREYGFASRASIMGSPEGHSRALWDRIAELGWIGAGLSEEDGGYGGGPIENAIIMEAFGRALVLEPFLSTAITALQALVGSPPGDTRDSLIADIVAGKAHVALAHSEPSAGGDPDHIGTRATRTRDGWRLNGHKSLVPGAQGADALLVTARAEDGPCLFLVRPDSKNVRVQPYRTLDNFRVGDVWLDDAAPDVLIAPPGTGLEAAQHGLDHAMVGVCAEAVGAMGAAISITRDHVKLRRQFGAALSDFQVVQHRMADMLVELELSRSILYQGISGLCLSGAQRIRSLSAMKAVVSAAAMFVGRNAVQLHGAIGMTEDCAVGHYYRRLFVIAHQFGNESAHLERVSRNPAPFWTD